RCRLAGKNLDLASKLIVQDAQAFAPLHSVPFIISDLTDLKLDFHENSRRFFIGEAGNGFRAELKKNDPASVTFTFNFAVNPSISTEPGRLHMLFARDGVSSGEDRFKFESSAIPGATYSEHNGTAEIVVNGTVPLMAEFGDNGKSIT